MRKVKKINVFGRNIAVKEADIEGFMGIFDGVKKEITINNKLSKKDYVPTLLHEMGHALFDRAGLRQSIPNELEEIVVEQFSDMINENFKLIPR